jgi:hypothetical protein
MNKTTIAAAFLLMSGCDSHDDDHDHGHGHDEAHEAQETPPAAEETQAAAAPVEAPLGEGTVSLTPAADRIHLTLTDAAGAAVAPDGEVRVVLTPTGGEEQRIVLSPDGEGWSGTASAAGASGYVAVVSRQQDGETQTARLTWGDAPEAPAEVPEHEHDEEDKDDGNHDHGHGH